MPASTLNRLHAAFTLALISLSCTAAAQDTPGGISYGSAPVLDCREVSKIAARGNWAEANGVGTEFGAVRRANLRFSDPIATDTFHATMNGAGARALALVEIQDTKGAWHKAWEGKMQPPAPGFEQTCFEQKLPQKQVVQGLRFTFRSAPGQVEINHAALLRR
ncbi:hypothetical protein SRABI118_00892 [Massilia sp. Bi118]|uniref:hypothetical protein n=1 Tax=Massilia sp. Bi118 TaxID=2822346 RepID=UPI001D42BEA2|nr:hypothetical protein [Massilia sp. Bi118]CAH0166493.1 hypothetical protein SRABI118_00892 [Massilia sp. Bi118]